MDSILTFIFLFTLVGFVISVIITAYKYVRKRPYKKNQKISLGFGGIMVIAFVLLMIITPTDSDHDVANTGNAENIENTQNQAQEEEQEEENEETQEEKNQKFVKKHQAMVKVMAESFIEDLEKQRIKIRIGDIDTIVYSSNIVRDRNDKEYPYTFFSMGKYEEKGTGALKEFYMVQGYEDEKALEDGPVTLLQYENPDTGTNINNINPEDDLFLKLEETWEESEKQ